MANNKATQEEFLKQSIEVLENVLAAAKEGKLKAIKFIAAIDEGGEDNLFCSDFQGGRNNILTAMIETAVERNIEHLSNRIAEEQ